MSKTVNIQYELNQPPRQFNVGEFVSIRYPHRTGAGHSPGVGKPTFFNFLSWINDLARKGLVYHSQFDDDYIFRVDGAVLEQLKNEISLDIDSKYEYTGGDPLYKTYSSLSLYLDGDVISQVSIP